MGITSDWLLAIYNYIFFRDHTLTKRLRKCTLFLLRSAWIQHRLSRKQRFWDIPNARSVLNSWEQRRGIKRGLTDPRNLLAFLADTEAIINQIRRDAATSRISKNIHRTFLVFPYPSRFGAACRVAEKSKIGTKTGEVCIP